MKYWSLFYTASPSGLLSGRSGFGVRTATEGTPAEILDAVQKDTSLNFYSFGTYQNNRWMTEPSEILAFPRRYFFRRLDGTGYCLFGRAVYAGYDFPYYLTKRPNRPGNYIVNLFAFESWPGRDVFSLLLEDAREGELKFLPEDFSPRLDNEEMLSLMTGTPAPIPVEDRPLGKTVSPIPSKSIDLYFSYLEALAKGLPMVVRTSVSESTAVAAGFMSILPDSLAAKTTFEMNHQGSGFAKGCAVTFINEYSISEISPLTCLFVDLVSGKRNVTAVETLWRSSLERENEHGGVSDVLTEWICSPIAAKNAEKSQQLNDALFNYCRRPDMFVPESLDIPGFIGTLASHCRAEEASPILINRIVSEFFTDLNSADKLDKAVAAAEKISPDGLLSDETLEAARGGFTSFVTSSVRNMAFVVNKYPSGILDKYLIRGKLRPLNELVLECLESDVRNIRDIVLRFEPSATKRVAMFVDIAKDAPQFVAQCREQLDKDREEASKIDYMTEFQAFYENSDFAPFFFGQLKSYVEKESPRTIAVKFSEMAQKNNGFARMLFGEDRIHQTLYSRFEPEAKPGSAEDIKFIETNVLELLPQDAPACRKWKLLRDVLAAECEGEKPMPFYSLALKLKAEEAVRKIAPMCFKEIDVDEIPDFLGKIGGMLAEEEIISFAKTAKPVERRRFLVEIARMYKYDYDRIITIAPEFGVSDKTAQRQLMKDNFPSVYKAHAAKEFFGKIKSLFGKKESAAGQSGADEKVNASEKSMKKKK